MTEKIGVLITNTGTPHAPTSHAVRRYLREFLSDKRIVQLPRIAWWPILYSVVLTTRPPRSAKLYQKIWTAQGSPMRIHMQKIAELLQEKFNAERPEKIIEVEIGMNYGQPSIQQGLSQLHKKKIEKIIVLPLFPQYSNTTTGSTFDRVTHALKKWSALPQLCFYRDYATHPDYIQALASTIRESWIKRLPAQHLLISFHGIPERYRNKGDPYAEQCERTAHLLAEELKLAKENWTLCYQSQFGYDKWLQPSTQSLLTTLPKQGITDIEVICPGFAVDCLETLEEIVIRGQESFLAAGGQSLRYIPALNESAAHIELLKKLIISHF